MGGDVTFDCAGVTDGDEVGATLGGSVSAVDRCCDSAGDLGAVEAGALGSATDGVGLVSAPYKVYISTL